MYTLNKIVEIYLQKNGIKTNFFAEYIGCEYTKCAKWLKGERKLNSEQIKKTYSFLEGEHLKSIKKLIRGKCIAKETWIYKTPTESISMWNVGDEFEFWIEYAWEYHIKNEKCERLVQREHFEKSFSIIE